MGGVFSWVGGWKFVLAVGLSHGLMWAVWYFFQRGMTFALVGGDGFFGLAVCWEMSRIMPDGYQNRYSE